MNKQYAYSLVALVALSASVLVKAEFPPEFIRETAVYAWSQKSNQYWVRHPWKTLAVKINEAADGLGFEVLEDKAIEVRNAQLAERAQEVVIEAGSNVVQTAKKVAEETVTAVKTKAKTTLSKIAQKDATPTPEESSESGGVGRWIKDNPKKSAGGALAVIGLGVWKFKG